MGIEEDLENIYSNIKSINVSLLALNQKSDKLLEKEQPKDRQDMEKVIRMNTLTIYIKDPDSKKEIIAVQLSRMNDFDTTTLRTEVQEGCSLKDKWEYQCEHCDFKTHIQAEFRIHQRTMEDEPSHKG